MEEVRLPELGEEIEKAVVSFWYFKAGDRVKKDDDLVELATDKATFNVPAPIEGVLKEIRAKEGSEVKIGEILAVIE